MSANIPAPELVTGLAVLRGCQQQGPGAGSHPVFQMLPGSPQLSCAPRKVRRGSPVEATPSLQDGVPGRDLFYLKKRISHFLQDLWSNVPFRVRIPRIAEPLMLATTVVTAFNGQGTGKSGDTPGVAQPTACGHPLPEDLPPHARSPWQRWV